MIGVYEMILILILVVGGIPALIALIDVLRNEFTGNNKLVWLLVVLLLPLVGALLYFIIGRTQKIKR
jgi:hypothetical protein